MGDKSDQRKIRTGGRGDGDETDADTDTDTP